MDTVKSLIAASAVVSTAAFAAPPSNSGGAGVNAPTQKIVSLNSLTGNDASGDFVFATWDGTATSLTATGSACIWSNHGGYQIKAQSTNGNGAFEMVSAAGDALAYSVAIAGTSLAAEDTYEARTITQGDRTCSSSPTVDVMLTVDDSALELAPYAAGGYSDTLTLIVSTN